jgi:hypothetical protein
MFKAYSLRNLNPYSGQVQIVESEHARAVSMDGEKWEIHFFASTKTQSTPSIPPPKGLIPRLADLFKLSKKVPQPTEISRPRKVFARYGILSLSALEKLVTGNAQAEDRRILELAHFLVGASLPFTAIDKFECWLLDSNDGSPLALIYSCTKLEEQSSFPDYPQWTALPAALMPIETNEEEQRAGLPPVNYRLERLVAERAGANPRACWFERKSEECKKFPPFLVKEDWLDKDQNELCRRYLERQSPRLLMLHGLGNEDRKRLELASRSQSLEVERFYPLYPDVADSDLMKSIRVEARLRSSLGEKIHDVRNRWS